MITDGMEDTGFNFKCTTPAVITYYARIEDAEEDWIVIYLVDSSICPSEYSKGFDFLLPNQNDSKKLREVIISGFRNGRG